MKDINRPVLWIVVPCFNEEEVLPQTAPMLKEVLSDMVTQGKIHESSAILFVNDGSSDSTWELIRQFAADSPQIRGISLSRNRGHQNALLAGLMEAKDMCDITISIDCDGQDDLQAMYEMVDKYREGFDIVYGVRSDRETDTWFKRTSARGREPGASTTAGTNGSRGRRIIRCGRCWRLLLMELPAFPY